MATKYRHNTPFVTAMVAAILGIAACGELPSGVDQARLSSRSADTDITTTTVAEGLLWNDPLLWFRRAWVCKVGSAATFEVSVDGGTPVEHTLADGECRVVHYNDGGQEEIDLVTVTELSSVNTVLDSIVQDSTHNEDIWRLPTITGTVTTTIKTFRSKGGIAVFYNSAEPPPPPPPTGGEGCTPGYWKQKHHFDSWAAPYTPNMLFSDVFENAFPGKTLLQVLSAGGGGLTALGRHTVAALLSSANSGVEYDMNTAGVIGAFNAAFPGGDFEGVKNVFERYNEQGCPLN